MSVYKVIGVHAYREHKPGETFEADLPPDVEQRALDRGDITLLRRSKTQLQPGTYSLPTGWAQPQP